MPQKYEVQGPDGATYEVEAPEGATEAMIVAQVAKAVGQPVDLTDFGLSDAEAAAVASGKPPRRANTALENISSGAQEVLDGVLPGAGRFMAGVGGAIGNTLAAPLSDKVDWNPLAAFKEEQDASDGTKEQFEDEHPDIANTAWGAGLVGSLALPQAQVFRGSRIASGMGNAALNGAGYGALSGLLNDSGDGRLANAGMGALAGSVIGGVAPPLLHGAGAVTSAARRNIPGIDAAARGIQNIPRRFSGAPLAQEGDAAAAQAERILGDELGDATIATGMGTGNAPATPTNMMDEVGRRQSLGVPAMPADVTEKGRRITSWALQGQGPMATRARNMLMQRQAQSASRIRNHLGTELGPAVDPIQEAETISRRASAAAEPDYRRAYAQGSPMVITEELQALMRRPAFQRAIPQAYENIQNRGGNPEALGFVMGRNGITLSPQPNFEAFDQVVRTLNKGIKRNEFTGRPILDNESGAINDVMLDLDGYLKRSNGAYADAKGNFADEMAVKDALRRGQDVSNLTGDEIASQLRTMPDHAQEAWMAGARTSLANDATQAGLKPTANVAQRTRQSIGLSGAGSHAAPGDPRKLQAIETMSGRPGVMNRLDDRLEAEDQAFKTFSESFGNSKTQPRQAMDEALSGQALDVASRAARGDWAGAVASVLFKGNPRGTLRFKRQVQDRIAEVMTATAPGDVRGAMQAIMQRAQTDAEFAHLLNEASIRPAKIAAIHAAAQSTDPVPDDDQP